MKKKIIIALVFAMLILFSLYTVQAFSGELAPSGLVSLPDLINHKSGDAEGIATGTISVTDSSYEISYQRSDITEATYKNIVAKSTEINEYSQSVLKEKKEKEDNIKKLQTAYTELENNSSATQENKDTAKAALDTATNEYNKFIEEANTKLEKLRKEMSALVPDYTTSWTKTTKTENNVKIDLSKVTEKVYFVLWVKLENGTKTYYDYNIYSADSLKEEQKPQNGEYTDFSKSQIVIEPNVDVRSYKLAVSNIEVIDGHTYYFDIVDENTTPELVIDGKKQFTYNKDKKRLEISNVSQYLELGQDQYLYVYEVYLDSESKQVKKTVLEKAKIQKPEQKLYTDAFFATYISESNTQIAFNTPWGNNTTRKIHLRIGKITDDTILRNIYNKKSDSFAELLKYAKSANAFYDQTIDSNFIGSAGGYSERKPLFNGSNIIDGEYYFMYALVEDENGKYVSTEGVTLSRATKSKDVDSWALFFYGSSDFSWKDFSNGGTPATPSGDGTVAPGTLPKAGLSNIILIVITVALVIGTITYKKYGKLRDIK